MRRRLTQRTQELKHRQEWTLPTLFNPQPGAVSILSTFPEFRFITITLLMSTLDDFHRG